MGAVDSFWPRGQVEMTAATIVHNPVITAVIRGALELLLFSLLSGKKAFPGYTENLLILLPLYIEEHLPLS
jgi:hypothetical protein